jgi:AcrR family transcriptional regulator
MSDMNRAPRSYDARRRRERAEDERARTRAAVLAAARGLFIERGYAATTMAAVAERAGVAVQSVYKAAGSKAELLSAVHRAALRGSDGAPSLAIQDWVQEIATQPDPREQIRMLGRQFRRVSERASPLWPSLRDAAAVDPRVAEEMLQDARNRLRIQSGFVRLVRPEHLREGLTYEGAADILWATCAPEVQLLFLRVRGWDHDRLEAWLVDRLTQQLLRAP